MKQKIKRALTKATTRIDRAIYKNKDFVIISNNCWGAEIYKRLGAEYNTPFVGLFIYAPDYLKLLQNLDFYLDSKLSFQERSKWVNEPVSYPIGVLEDIEIHFMHYENSAEAESKWSRRLERMRTVTDLDKYYFKICDRDFSDKTVLNAFHELPFKNKISFGIDTFDQKNHIVVIENENNQTVPDGVKLYRHGYKYVDILEWINSGEITKNFYGKIKSLVKIV